MAEIAGDSGGHDCGNREKLDRLLSEVKRIHREYRTLTDRPLGVTGEVAELEAARILGLDLCPARTPGYDAIRHSGSQQHRIQIKGRCLLPRAGRGGRLGKIKLNEAWDAVVLVLLDQDLEAIEIHEADREAVERALTAPGSKSRNERGALAISKFKSIGRRTWTREAGFIAPALSGLRASG
jgi:hypothetical protein